MASRYMLSTWMGFCGVYVNSFTVDEEAIKHTHYKFGARFIRIGACWTNLGSFMSDFDLYILRVVLTYIWKV